MPPPCIPLCPCPPSPAHSHSPPHFTTSSHRQSWSDECEREAIKQFSLSATPQPRRKVIPPFPVLLGKRRREGEGGPFHLPQIRIKKKKKKKNGAKDLVLVILSMLFHPNVGCENPSLILVQSPLRGHWMHRRLAGWFNARILGRQWVTDDTFRAKLPL